MVKKYQKPDSLVLPVKGANFHELVLDALWANINNKLIDNLWSKFSPDKFLKQREIPEIHVMWLLQDAVDIFESLYKSKKTLIECAQEKGVDKRRLNLIFEACLGQVALRAFSESKDENFEWCLNDDLVLQDPNLVKIFKPSRGMSNKEIIKEIRDWISHRRYVLWKNWLYIYNPQGVRHKETFEASVKFKYLIDTPNKMWNVTQKYRIEDFCPEENIDFSLWFNDNLWNFSIRKLCKKKKTWLNRLEYVERISEGGHLNAEEFEEYVEHLSSDQEKILWLFFDKYGFNWTNLWLGLSHMDDVSLRHMTAHDFMYIFFLSMKNFNISRQDLVSEDFLTEAYVQNGYNFADIGAVKDIQLKALTKYYIELMPNYLKMLYIINSYVNDVNITFGLWEQMDETTHIRHALAHWYYSLLPWIKEILLCDPKSGYSKRFDIDKMYEERKEYEKKRKDGLTTKLRLAFPI